MIEEVNFESNQVVTDIKTTLWKLVDMLSFEPIYQTEYTVLLFLLLCQKEAIVNGIKPIDRDPWNGDLHDRINNDLGKSVPEFQLLNSEYAPIINKLSFEIQVELIKCLSDLNKEVLINHFQEIFEDLLTKFSNLLGRGSMEFFLPAEISRLVIELADLHEDSKIYNPFAGLASLGIFLPQNVQYIGQELLQSTWIIGLMRVLAHRNPGNSSFIRGDSIREWIPINEKFDLIVACPPVGVKFTKDLYGDYSQIRSFEHYFIARGIESLKPHEGKLIAFMPKGFLSRSGPEKDFRKYLVENDLLETVISLPGGLLGTTGIPLCIVVINNAKNNLGKVRFIEGNDFVYYSSSGIKKLNDDALGSAIKGENESDAIRYIPNKDIRGFDYSIDASRYFLVKVEGPQLDDIVTISRRKRSNYKLKGKFLRIRDLKDDVLDYHIIEDELENLEIPLYSQEVSESCLLVAVAWKNLKPSYFKYESTPIYLAKDIIALKVKESKVDIGYLINELHENYVTEQVEAYRTGSVVPMLRSEDLLRIRIKLPLLIDQQKAKIEGVKQEKIKSRLKDEEYQSLISDLKKEMYDNIRIKKHNILQHLNNVKISADLLYRIMQVNDGLLKADTIINPTLNIDVNKRFLRMIESLEEALFYVDTITDELKFDDNIEHFKIRELVEECIEKGRHEEYFNIELYVDEQSYTYSDFEVCLPEFDFSRKDFMLVYNNILENAILHGFVDKNKKYTFLIQIGFDVIEGKSVISFSNNGKPFPKGMAERFSLKGEKAGPNANKGLGSWFVCEIAKHYNAEIIAYDLQGDEFPVKIVFIVDSVLKDPSY